MYVMVGWLKSKQQESLNQLQRTIRNDVKKI